MPRGLNPYDEARLQRRLWTPALLGAGLLGWWDASRIETVTLVSSVVSQWDDLSGKGNHLVQGTAGSRPALGTFAGRPAVILDGANDFLTTTNVSPQNLAIFAVFGYPNNNSQPPFVWSRNDGSDTVNLQEVHLSSSGSIRAVNNELGPYANTASGTPQSFYDDCIIGAAYGESGNNVMRAHLNGMVETSATTRQDSNTNTHYFGRRGSTASPFFAACRFSEIVMITHWTVPDLQMIEGYLAHKWGGLPLSRMLARHPYRNRPPLIGD